jgi:CRISPR-associated endonuclease/helicase Cas3
MTHLTGADDCWPGWLSRGRLPVPVQVLVTGVVVVADWLASDTDRFGYQVGPVEERLAGAGLARDLPPAWAPAGVAGGILMERRFPMVGARPRPLQTAAQEVAASCEEPPLLVVEAGTGEGKTEAALLAAEALADRFGQGGVVFALPTQATTDGIFPRLLGWVERLELGGPASVFLAHGKSGLNDDYQGLLRRGGRVGPIYDETDASAAASPATQVVVSSWLRGRRRGLHASFVAATIDQVLFGALRARHLPLRHLALAGKVVIVDEVHAADDFMRVYLARLLEWLGAHGTPVILLSATLPADVRHELVGAYRHGAGASPASCGPVEPGADDRGAYPSLTVASRSGSVTVAVEGAGQPERQLSVRLVGDDWLQDVAAAIRAGACVAVISNTVARAQDVARRLRAVVGPDRVMLVHSQFLAVHRAALEREVRHRLGPPGPARDRSPRPKGFVVCGTQVLEQSLDIDVDLMLSDIAPIDLLVQRAGRLHRHHRPPEDRPVGQRSPCLLISGARLTSELPNLDPGCVAVYGRYRLLRALDALTSHLGGVPISLPADTPRLVARGYSAEVTPPASWAAVWAEAEAEHRTLIARQRDAARAFALPPVEELTDLTEFSRGAASDPDGPQAARARVRDSEDSVEVIVVREGADGFHALPGTGLDPASVIPGSLGPPAEHVARALLRCTVRLPRRLCRPGAIDATIRSLESNSHQLEGWRRSRWLEGELALVLDHQLRATVAGVQLEYSMQDGLSVVQTGDHVHD